VPELDKFYRDHKNDCGILLIASYDDSPSDVNTYVANVGCYLPALLDTSGAIASAYIQNDKGEQWFPSEVFIDANGLIRRTQVGAMTEAEMWSQVQTIAVPSTTYAVTANVSGGHGQVTPASQTVAPGTQASITIAPDQGYQIATISANGVAQAVTDPTGMVFTISDVRADRQVVVTFSAQQDAFPDIATSPYKAAITELASRGIIGGFSDGTFHPDDPVTRQQFAKMIVRTLGLTVTGSEVCPFGDVVAQVGTDSFYPSKYIAVCAANNITAGKTATTFAPSDNITHQQLITMVARAAKLDDPAGDYTPGFAAGQFTLEDHYLNARKAAFAGLLDGLQGVGASYNFLAPATRGECAQILYKLSMK
jgi:hypothetical protein